MAYTVQVEHFEGPLDLLLQLVEKNELEVSKISLAGVTDQFVLYMQSKVVPPEELADFLVVASKLIYLKSKLLLPDFQDQEMEEGPDLESQLRLYQMFVTAARGIDKQWKLGDLSFSRSDQPMRKREVSFVPPENVGVNELGEAMKRVIARLEPIIHLPQVAVRRALSIHDRIRELFSKIRKHAKGSFREFIKGARHKEDAVVTFLALLELIKQKFVMVEQNQLFQDINISLHPEAPEQDPLVQSFN